MRESRPTRSRPRARAPVRRRSDVDDRRRRPPRVRSRVDQQVDAIAERPLDLDPDPTVAGSPLTIRAGRGDRTSGSRADRTRDGVGRHSDADVAGAAGHVARSDRRGRGDHAASTAPARSVGRDAPRHGRQAGRDAPRPAPHRRRSTAARCSARASLHGEHARRPPARERIGGEPVERVGRNGDHAAVAGSTLPLPEWHRAGGDSGSTKTRRITVYHGRSTFDVSPSTFNDERRTTNHEVCCRRPRVRPSARGRRRTRSRIARAADEAGDERAARHADQRRARQHAEAGAVRAAAGMTRRRRCRPRSSPRRCRGRAAPTRPPSPTTLPGSAERAPRPAAAAAAPPAITTRLVIAAAAAVPQK